jgi:two-component system LytT family response regulator
MKAIIIEDEKKGREILQKLLNDYCGDVEVVATAADAEEGYEMIRRHAPDLVFLDIEMPGGNGFELLEKFDEINFHIVFTTAYDSYALKAIKFHALDYLLKPIDIDELCAAVAHAQKILNRPQPVQYREFIETRKLDYNGRISLPVKEGLIYVKLSDIVRIESDGGYSTFYILDGSRHIVSRNLKDYEDILPADSFFRVHKSHLINIRRVKKYLRNDGYFVEMEDGSTIEIARRKKDEFLQAMSDLS